ncbi:toxin co-regulated pilus biosynthesis Q family protein [Pseudomonas sp. RP23018S]|uniref:toxin co-regulated pilus biosynthesis Q family protein n=1 Tax=Pseudomonas sp. RP23018S TaxID=3096037 RepID=UPI002ACAD40F|nr:toxin co-regulated pilus biosynthesis Q family protein [Pseudomonas sp. RP23018S]MDZ5605285.1 toxin co-regulated pilus biosynthesis Q family protein [Pseudomonas sp. RP23018S]
MKLSQLAVALMAVATFSSTASASFGIDDSGIIGAERGQMGKHEPYSAQGKATFIAPSGSMEPKQARYKDAELLVDLAYTPVTQRGSGEPGIVPGFGEEIPFDDAMGMILPKGWQVYRAKQLDKKAVPSAITFAGGQTWPEVMKAVGERYELHFHIDWFDHTIMISKGRPSGSSLAHSMRIMPEPSRQAGSLPATNSSSAPGRATTFAAGKGTAVMPPAAVPPTVQAGGLTKPALNTQTSVAAYVPPKPAKPALPTWIVSAKDRTIREALKSWSRTANWTFEPEHWAVPVDIPITAGAPFSGDFKAAVRQLISTTELGDTPLQPCFYSNRVVRVVPINQVCDQMSAR